MSDEDIFNVDEKEAYNSEAAMKYLAEANELSEQLENCSKDLEKQKLLIATFRTLNKMQFDDIIEMKKTIREKNFAIDKLKQKIAKLMGNPNKLQVHEKVSAIKPEKIIKRTQEIHRGIQHDQMLFKRTGIYQNFDSRISEVRDLFNLMLMQLNMLNEKNHAVTRILDALQKLDVN